MYRRCACFIHGHQASSGTCAHERQLEHVAESRAPYDAGEQRHDKKLTEAQLTRIWRGQRFPEGALVTRGGVPVTVIDAGRPGRGPGPDFRRARIAGPSGIVLRGDVELHVRSSSFRAHGHEQDRAYANVILHVVFDDDTGEDTPLPGGKTAPVVALAPWVARRAGEIERWLSRPLLWQEPCHDAFDRLGRDAVLAALDGEGDRRFEEKVRTMRTRIGAVGIEQALYEALFQGLGYGGNSAQMLALAQLITWERLAAAAAGESAAVPRTRDLRPASRDVCARFEGLLLGGAGLLPSQRWHDQRATALMHATTVDQAPATPHVADLEREFASTSLPSLSLSGWKLWGVRPENAPARRIAAMAALLARLGSPAAALDALRAEATRDVIVAFSVQATGFWLDHHDTCAAPCALPPALIGRSRALELLINGVLPAAAASGDATLVARARDLYAQLPRPAVYGATKFLDVALTSGGDRPRINARRAQALLALNRDWCTQGGCGRCPLS